ncbi:ArsR/SmtB family transcription factor [Pseudonocardia humida]|uniref:Helix-turn-helix transcriptional regulator n=1 Tax=Pseudonocardia humida TaxID=2800819 RepID=A0ABT1AA08_9PSEU|nr:ArsR family transcriptional regulator [Pseudonocardia humida]MCO1659778.1 helix-turn-helix transcriptional regulator [Pseudonocardia humida]
MLEPHHPDLGQVSLAEVLRGLSDPARLHMVKTMYALGECECSLVYADLGLSKSNASHHFRVLRESGILRRTQRGNQQYATLRADELKARFPGLLEAVIANSGAGSGVRADPGPSGER